MNLLIWKNLNKKNFIFIPFKLVFYHFHLDFQIQVQNTLKNFQRFFHKQ